MAVYNTASDAANTAVRAFLTRIGEYYHGKGFNTGSGKGLQDWTKIRDEVFEGKCAYCGKSESKLQIEHIIMFNREEYGLHHPGNIAPVCHGCNKRGKNEKNQFLSWENHLYAICTRNNEIDQYEVRLKKIKHHINDGEFKYPVLTNEERNAISIIANNLYESVKNEFEQAVRLYQELDKAYIKK